MASFATSTFACADPGSQAACWAEAAGPEVQEAPPGLIEAIEVEVDRLVERGATVVETKTEATGPYTETWTVTRGTEDNDFCVQANV